MGQEVHRALREPVLRYGITMCYTFSKYNTRMFKKIIQRQLNQIAYGKTYQTLENKKNICFKHPFFNSLFRFIALNKLCFVEIQYQHFRPRGSWLPDRTGRRSLSQPPGGFVEEPRTTFFLGCFWNHGFIRMKNDVVEWQADQPVTTMK